MDDEQYRRFWREENGPRNHWMQFLLSLLIMLRQFTADSPAFLMLQPTTQESFRDFAAFIQIISHLWMTEMFGEARCLNRDPVELLRLLRFGSRVDPAQRPEEGDDRRRSGGESTATSGRQEKADSDGRRGNQGRPVWRGENRVAAWRQRIGGSAPCGQEAGDQAAWGLEAGGRGPWEQQFGGPPTWMQGFGGAASRFWGMPGVKLKQIEASVGESVGGAKRQRTPGEPGVGEEKGWRIERRNGNLCNNCGSYLHCTEGCPLPHGRVCSHAIRRLWNRGHRGQSARFNPYQVDRELHCSFCNVFGHCIYTCDVFQRRYQIWCPRCERYGSHLPSNFPGNA